MNRSLDYDQLVVSCTRGHPAVPMKQLGFYALREAGRPTTILGFECSRCLCQRFVSEIPYERSAVDRSVLADIDAQE